MQSESHFQEMHALASCGARITDIESHDPHGLVTEAAIAFANVDFDVECEDSWPDGFRSASVAERIKFVARMFDMRQITEATSYWSDVLGRRLFHIGFWHATSSGGERREGSCRFETDLDRAKAHAKDVSEIALASKKVCEASSEPKATVEHRTDTI